MVAVIGTMVFTGALVLSLTAIGMSVAPQWRRILRLASGQMEEAFNPLQQLALAERRIAVRRWASAPVPASIRQLRGAA